MPGWGQLAMGQSRGWAYLAAEGLAWTLHLSWRSQGHDLRDAYRDLAWSAARIEGGGERVDPDFSYYERLESWRRSGAWDAQASEPGVQPEEDPSTYNGMLWGRARDLFLRGDPGARPGDPGYDAALAYYMERAYGPSFLWDWTGKENDLDRYGDLIDDSDAQLRRATHALGAVLANHMLSGVDAWISSHSGRDVRSRLLPSEGPLGPAWTWAVAVSR